MLHLLGFRFSPAIDCADWKIGKSNLRNLKARSATPISSAQALKIPAFFPSISYEGDIKGIEGIVEQEGRSRATLKDS